MTVDQDTWHYGMPANLNDSSEVFAKALMIELNCMASKPSENQQKIWKAL